jgi:hypothetical protein
VSLATEGGWIGATHHGDAIVGVLEEHGEDFFEAIGVNRAAKTFEDIGIEDGILFGVVECGGGAVRTVRDATSEGGTKTLGGKWLAQNAIIAVEPGGRGSAHGEEQSPWRGLAKRTCQICAAEAGHTNVGQNAVWRISGGKFEGLRTAVGLKDDTTFRFQQHRGDREADWIVVDGQDTSGNGGRPGIHVGTILHTDCDGFTLHLRCFNRVFAIGALVSWA